MARHLKEYVAWQVCKFYSNTTTFECIVECEEQEKDHEFCVYTLKKFKTVKDGRLLSIINYQHFKILVEAYKTAHSEKNKNTSQTAVGKVWKKLKADFPAADDLEEVVRRQTSEWKTLSFTKRSKMTDF